MSHTNVLTSITKKELAIPAPMIAVLGVASFTLATIAGAFIKIYLPFTPVPLSLQTFFVILSGAFIGRRLGAASQLSYILLGVVGLPVFVKASNGLAYLLGPTGGYLLGFVAAAWLIGRMLNRSESLAWITLSMAAGSFLILALGSMWLSVVLHISVARAFLIGMVPFLPGDAVKTVTAAAIYFALKGRIRKIYPL